jgi:hypothetical protein
VSLVDKINPTLELPAAEREREEEGEQREGGKRGKVKGEKSCTQEDQPRDNSLDGLPFRAKLPSIIVDEHEKMKKGRYR